MAEATPTTPEPARAARPKSRSKRARSERGDIDTRRLGARDLADIELLYRLEHLCELLSSSPRALTDEDLADLPRLYRAAASITSRLVTRGDQPAAIRESRRVLQYAHGVLHFDLHRGRSPWYRRFPYAMFVEGPREIRRSWKLFLAMSVGFYGLAIFGYAMAVNDLQFAFQVGDPNLVSSAIAQLDALEPGEAWEGNFTFDFEQSGGTAGMIMANNLSVCLLWVAVGFFLPLCVWLVGKFAVSIGAYVGVARHWGQDGSILSILMCHGTLELTAAILSCSAGALSAWTIAFPGRYSRGYAAQRVVKRALTMLAPAIPMLVAAGLIEGYVSPHAPNAVRVAVAVLSAIVMIAWFGFVGREAADRGTDDERELADAVNSTARGSRS